MTRITQKKCEVLGAKCVGAVRAQGRLIREHWHSTCTAIACVAMLALVTGCRHSLEGKVPLTPPSDGAQPMTMPMTTLEPSTQSATRPVPADEEPTTASVEISGQFITVDDVLMQARGKLEDLPRSLTRESFRLRARGILDQAFRELLSQAAVYQQAKNLTDNQKDQIDRAMEAARHDMLVQAGGSSTRLEQMLAAEGLTLTKALENHRRRLIVQRFLRARFESAMYVSPKSMWEYYLANKAQFTTPRKVQMQVIAVKYALLLPADAVAPSTLEIQSAKTKAKEQAQQAAAAIANRTDFGQVAAQFSMDPMKDQKGLWPPMAEGSFAAEKVEKAAFAMSAGQTSGIIECDGDCYIVRCVQAVAPAVMPFEQAQVQIERTLREQRYNEAADEYFSKLLNGAKVRQSDDFIPTCVDQAVQRFWQK